MEISEMRERAKKLVLDGQKLLEPGDGGEPSSEDINNAQKMFEDAKELRSKADRLQGLRGQAAEQLKAFNEEREDTELHQREPDRFKDWGEYLHAVKQAAKGGAADNRLMVFDDEAPRGRKVLSGASGGGNYIIPDQFATDVQAMIAEQGMVRSRANVIPTDRRTFLLPVLDQTDNTANRPHWFGGLVFYWEDEAATITESDFQFKQAEVQVNELTGATLIANSTLADSPVGVGAMLEGPMGFGGGAAWMEDYAFLRGDGVGKPLGVVNAPATVAVTRGASGVTFANLVAMLEAFQGENGLWVANRTLMSNLMTMTGPAGQPSYLWGSAKDGVPTTLLGYPIVFTEKAPSADAKGDIGLYDFGYYAVLDRQAQSIDMDPSPKFLQNQTAFRLVHRVGGRPWLSSPITLQDGSTQVSPFVALAAA